MKPNGTDTAHGVDFKPPPWVAPDAGANACDLVFTLLGCFRQAQPSPGSVPPDAHVVGGGPGIQKASPYAAAPHSSPHRLGSVSNPTQEVRKTSVALCV